MRQKYGHVVVVLLLAAAPPGGCAGTLEGGPDSRVVDGAVIRDGGGGGADGARDGRSDVPSGPADGAVADRGDAAAGGDLFAPLPDGAPRLDGAVPPADHGTPVADRGTPPADSASPAPDRATPAPDQRVLVPDAAAGQILWAARHETGDKSEWYAPSTGPTGNYGGAEVLTGNASAAVVTTVAHGGTRALSLTITTPGSPTAGARFFRWAESRANRALYYSAWFYLPTAVTPNGSGLFWNLFQFKSRSTGGRDDPLWAFYADADGKGGVRLRAGWGYGGATVAGPKSGDSVGAKNFYQTTASLPVGKWVHLEAFLRQSSGFDGQVTLWQDGVKLFDFTNVRTSYANGTYNSWNAENEWAVLSYSDGLSPSPATIFIDDAVISTTRVGP